jgi:hypothetical protein
LLQHWRLQRSVSIVSLKDVEEKVRKEEEQYIHSITHAFVWAYPALSDSEQVVNCVAHDLPKEKGEGRNFRKKRI